MHQKLEGPSLKGLWRRAVAGAALLVALSAVEAAAQNAVCSQTNKFCSKSLDNACLSRFGAGVLGVPGEEMAEHCAAQLSEYRDCLSLVAAQCPQHGALEKARPKAAAPAAASALEIWNEIKEFEDADVFEAFAESYPSSPLAVLAGKRAAAIRAATTPGAAPASAPDLAPSNEETAEGERAARDEEQKLRAQLMEAQGHLNRIGYDAGPVDGAWGRRSGTALARFLEGLGRPPTRILTPDELALLRAAPSDSARRRATAAVDGPPAAAGRVAKLTVTFRYRDRTTKTCSGRSRVAGGALDIRRLKLSCPGRSTAFVWLKTDASGRGLSVQAQLNGDRVTLNGTSWRYSGLRSGPNNKNELRSAALSVSF